MHCLVMYPGDIVYPSDLVDLATLLLHNLKTGELLC
jgi:hypothetical protein